MREHTLLEVCEIFYSLQGESTYSGMPCVFIRLAECNLDCSYCDTKYSHQPGSRMSIPQVLDTIRQYPSQLVEITGGEPLLQDESIALMEALHEQNYRILLETNGSLYLGEVPDYVVKIIDVKTPGSGFGDSFMKWNLKCLKDQDELKFVLTSHYDYQFALDFINEHQLWERTLLFSPVLSILPAEVLAAWMQKDGVQARLQLQLHRILDLK
jgi:7-carboxy-7-deazaguanine synthase